MILDNNTQAFLALVRAGLWENDVQLEPYGDVDFNVIYRLAQEQSVVGLVAAGLEHIADIKIPKEEVLLFVGEALQLEQRNTAMNNFIGGLIEKMRAIGIDAVLVKGQGVAQCYKRPLWRSSGDIDLLLSEENFHKAREFLRPLTKNGFDPVFEQARNISAQVSLWEIELHDNQFCGLSNRVDLVIKEIQDDIFFCGNVRSWMNGKTPVFLPGINNDILFVFTHFLKHFFKGGLGLRQICDWCRLLWTNRSSIDYDLLGNRLRRMGLLSEWRAFGYYAVNFLGMPEEAMPFYITTKRWGKKAVLINCFLLEVGNMGHNRDNSYYGKSSFFVRKVMSYNRRVLDLCRHSRIFPVDSVKFLIRITSNGVIDYFNKVGYRDLRNASDN